MTKKELLRILASVPDDALVQIGLQDPRFPDFILNNYIGQIVQELPETYYVEGKRDYFPGYVYMCPKGHEPYDAHPDPIPHPEDESQYRVLYDSSVPLTPPLESEKNWPCHQSR
ncbi:MAG: hypothetical protein ACYC3I_16605 [Gemmataceae bacterium]